MMHLLLTNPVVQEAAVEEVPAEPESESSSEDEDGGGAEGGSSSSSSKAKTKGKPRQTRSFLRTCLVLVPKNVLLNWRDELNKVQSIF